MKLIAQILLILSLSSVFLVADSARKVKLKGHLVDISCATEKSDDLNYMRTEHTRKCFQMPACVKSGYGVLMPNDSVVRFDKAGNEQAQKLIQSATRDKDWRIVVRGKQAGDIVQVTRLELQK